MNYCSVSVPDWKDSVVCLIPRRVALLTNNPIRPLRCHVRSMGQFVDGLKFSGGSHSLMPKAYIKEVTYMVHKYNVYVSTGDCAEHLLHKGPSAFKEYIEVFAQALSIEHGRLPCLTNLESFNLDSCRIDDEGLVNLTGTMQTEDGVTFDNT
ncbi:unnamed protein product [Camellia sinensis]